MSDRSRYSAARTVRFGAAAVVAAAAGVVGLATPASAADLTPSQLKGPVSGTNTITLTGLTAGTGNFPATPTVQFQAAANNAAVCSTAPGTASGTTIVAVPSGNISGGNSTTLSVVVPGTAASPALAAGAYNICVYNGTTSVAKTVLATRYTAVAVGSGTLDTTRGPSVGGNTITLTDTTTQFGPTTAVQFNSGNSGACPTTYQNTATGTIATASTPTPTFNSDKTAVTVTVPSGLTATIYSVCAYTGSTATTSALVSKVDAGYGLVFPLTVAPASGPTAGTNTIKATAPNAIFTGTPRVEFNLLPCPTAYATPAGGVVVAATNVTRTDSDAALTFTVPALLPTAYYVCAYQPVADGNALTAASATAAYTAGPTGTLALDVAGGSAGSTTAVVVTDASARFGAGTVVQLNTAACPSTLAATPAAGVSSPITPGAFTAGATSLSITVPSGLTESRYYVCAYTGNTATTSALITGTSTAAFDVVHPFDTLSVTTGPDAGGYQITAADDQGAFTGTIGVKFSTAACSPTYGANAGVAGTATVGSPTSLTINVPALGVGTHYICAYKGNSTGDALNSETTTAAFTARNTDPLTLSSTNGKSGTANSFTATIPSGLFPTDAVVRFVQAAACPEPAGSTVVNTNVVAGTVRRVSPGNKLAITTGSMTALARKVCVYDTTATTLLAESTVNYVTAAGVTIDSISPTAGPAQGGTLVTVGGTNFANGLTATIGGIPLTQVTVGGGGTFFTAITPPHAPGGPFDLVVSSASGPVTLDTAFSYSNGIEITPNSAPNTDSVDISVSGVGFTGIDFTTSTPTTGDTPAAAYGHVYLVKGEYDPTPLHTSGFKVNDMLLECVDVLVIDDTELVCTLYLNGLGGVDNDANEALRPTYRASAVAANDVDIAAGSNTITSASDIVFTAADIGLTVDHANLPDGTTIVQVVNGTTAILSAKATAVIAPTAVVDFLPPRAETVTALSLGSPTALAGGTNFAASDVGRRVSGDGIQPGTTIASVANATTATLSKPITEAGATSIIVGDAAVPNGTYTITVVSNGALNADVSDSTYTQSIITSTSTFTVADY